MKIIHIILFLFCFSCSDLFLTEIKQAETDCIIDSIDCTYSEHIKPIFDANCISCHGFAGGLNLNSYSGLMNGGNHGSIVIEYDSENSFLYQKIS